MWVDENYKVRNDLAHGNEPVNVEKVASVVDKLDIIQRVAYRFLQDWRDKLLYGDGNYQAKGCQTLMKTSRSIECGIR